MTWLDDLTEVAHQGLNEQAVDAYLARGVSESQLSLYRLGYLDHLPDLAYPPPFREWVAQRPSLREIMVLPLTNTLGTVRGVQFRTVTKGRSAYSDFIEATDEPVLFGLAQAMPFVWEHRSVFLVEGGFDLFPVQRVCAGVVATLTARITSSMVRLLRRLVDRIWVGYDADTTGRNAAADFVKYNSEDFDIRVVRYPQVPMVGTARLTKDPGDLWETWGDTQFQQYLRPQLGSNTEPFHAQDLR